MINDQSSRTLRGFWSREGLGPAILEALKAAGMDFDKLSVDDLAPIDQFHGGGMGMTRRLASLSELGPGSRVLDVGGGLGGPARTLAVEYGCSVTLSDLTASYIDVAKMLTGLLGLQGSVTHVVADGLELPFDSGTFDVVWTQNSGMNIADKERFYEGLHRVLRPGGRLVSQEPMAGPVKPMIFPVMWARDASASFLRTPEEMRRVIESAGFRTRTWGETEAEKAPEKEPRLPVRIQTLVMGDELAEINAAGRRNNIERRIVMVQAVFERV